MFICCRCSCNMDLSSYPMDTQKCPFMLAGYGLSSDTIRLIWHKIPMQMVKDQLPIHNYDLLRIISENKTEEYARGSGTIAYDLLTLTFVVSRTMIYFMYEVYIPMFLLLIFNTASYWVPDTALPLRMTLVVTTFLTSILMLRAVNSDNVRSSTTTALQIFVTFSIGRSNSLFVLWFRQNLFLSHPRWTITNCRTKLSRWKIIFIHAKLHSLGNCKTLPKNAQNSVRKRKLKVLAREN